MAVADAPCLTDSGIKSHSQAKSAPAKNERGDLFDRLLPSDFRNIARSLGRRVQRYCQESGSGLQYVEAASEHGGAVIISVKDGADKEDHKVFKILIHPMGEVELWKSVYVHATEDTPVTRAGVVHESDHIFKDFVKGMKFRGAFGVHRATADKIFDAFVHEVEKERPKTPAQMVKKDDSAPRPA